MRLSLSVNAQPAVRASLEADGWLSAHVNLSQGNNSDLTSNQATLVAIDISEPPNSIHSAWGPVPLSVGDKIEILILHDGEADAPSEVTKTAESPSNLFTNIHQARLLLSAIHICDKELSNVANTAREKEPPEEFAKIQRAIGEVIMEIDRLLISPTLSKHPELFAEAEEKNLR